MHSSPAVTAGPGQYEGERPAGWFVVTDQALVLRGPLPNRPEAEAARDEILDNLRTSLQRDRRSDAFIDRRLAAVAIAHGRRTWPHGHFAPTPP